MTTKRQQKNLTVMFTDISGFTKHTETISRDDLMARLDQHNELLMPIIAHFDGKIVKTIGDAFLITFESPTNAVQCGLFMQHTLCNYNRDKSETEQIHIKVSINSGEVTLTETDVFGDPVNVAAKIEKATNPDEIYFTEAVFLAMNKAEVPTAFVKSFRPKGADSTEIKLYKVAMDEGDERYQKIITGTRIDEDRLKTRVAELSTLAEKEFSRYQDTLEALIESQSTSSRTVFLAIVAASLILAAGMIVGFVFLRPDSNTPQEQLASEVRAYLQTEQSSSARQRIERYVEEFGGDETTVQLLEEIGTFEVEQLSRAASGLIAEGRPEDTLKIIADHFGDGDLPEPILQIKRQAESYLAARAAIHEGNARAALDRIEDTFGKATPAGEIQVLRDQARALIQAEALYQGPERYREPLRILGTVSQAFGEDTQNEVALEYIEGSLANEMYRSGKENGIEKARAIYEEYRQQYPHVRTWDWINAQMTMGGIWRYRMDNSMWRNSRNQYWQPWTEVKETVADSPEQKYCFGCFNFMMTCRQNLAVCSGASQWRAALDADPGLAERHAELMNVYRVPLTEGSQLGQSLVTDLLYMIGFTSGEVEDVRALIKKYCYQKVRAQLVQWLNTEDGERRDEQLNALAIVAEMGEAAVIEDPFAVFRAQFDRAVTKSELLKREHTRTLFRATMSYEDYGKFRKLIGETIADIAVKKGPYSAYRDAGDILDAMLTDLKEAQSDHTERYEG